MRREERRQARAEKEEVVALTKQKKQDIQQVVQLAAEEGFPTGVNEKEQFFMDHVQKGELLAADRKSPTNNILYRIGWWKGVAYILGGL